jgi:hypothetical protein
MFVPPITEIPVTGGQAVECKPEGDETDADASVAASYEDNDHRCHESETVKRTNTFVVEELLEAPEEADGGQEDTNADAFVGSTYRDEESDCSGGYEADTEDGDDSCHPGPLSEESSEDTLVRSDCSDEKSNCHKEKENDESRHPDKQEMRGPKIQSPPRKRNRGAMTVGNERTKTFVGERRVARTGSPTCTGRTQAFASESGRTERTEEFVRDAGNGCSMRTSGRGQAGPENNVYCCVPVEDVSRQLEARTGPPQMKQAGNVPVSQVPTRSKTRYDNVHGPQMAMHPPQ